MICRDEEFAEDAAAMGASTELGTNENNEDEAPQNFAKNTSDFGTLANVDEDEGDRYVVLFDRAPYRSVTNRFHFIPFAA